MSVLTDEVDALKAKIDNLIAQGEASGLAIVKSIDAHIESLITVAGTAAQEAVDSAAAKIDELAK